MIANDHELGYQCEESEASVTAGSGGLVGVQGGSTEDSMIFGPSGGTLDSLMASVLLADCTDRVDNENEAASGTVPTGSPNKGKSAGERLTRNNCGSENKVEEEVPADDADKTEKPMSPRSQTQDVQDELAELRSDKQIKDLQIDELQRELSDLKSLLQKTIVTSLQSRSNSVPLHQHVYCPPTGGVANEFVPQSDSDTWGNISTTEAATLLVDTSKGTVTGGDLTVLAPSALPHHKAVRANGVIARLSSQAAAATAAAAAENSQRSAEPPTSAASSATSVFDYPDSLISGSASAEPGPLFRAFSAASSFEGEFRRASSAPSAPAISNTRGIIPPPIVTGKSIWSIDDATTLGPFSGLLGSDSASPTESSACERPSITTPPVDIGNAHFKNMWNYEDPAADYNYESQIFLQNFSSNSLEASSFTGYQYLVEKIVLANDQQASLNLQDVLKTGPVEAKTAVIDATFPHALSLIRNRFGNFLMQKCLEFGSRDQVRHLANIMIGHIYGLSCDRFGCHVVQKALDVCEDDVKVEIINELFRAIPETITHRFACHVWQRVFETKWTQCGVNYRPRIAHRVEAALRSQWHLVANDENGSLVVQCIFENCTETEKSAIGREVLAHTVDIAKGQWGNWVIQHLLEHGSPADKSHILKIVARNVHAMSVDQFASKVVEKGLKTCPKRDLYEIVDMVISPSRDNGRPSILDMMNNQYANYVVQHILTLSDPHQRDACARLIAPHLPILRGSKYGQRVAAIVEKHMRTSQQRFGTILGSSTNNVGHTVTVSNQSQLSTSSSIGSSYTSAPNNNYLPVSVGPTSLVTMSSNACSNNALQTAKPTTPPCLAAFNYAHNSHSQQALLPQQQQSHQSLHHHYQAQQSGSSSLNTSCSSLNLAVSGGNLSSAPSASSLLSLASSSGSIGSSAPQTVGMGSVSLFSSSSASAAGVNGTGVGQGAPFQAPSASSLPHPHQQLAAIMLSQSSTSTQGNGSISGWPVFGNSSNNAGNLYMNSLSYPGSGMPNF